MTLSPTIDRKPPWVCAECGCERRATAHQRRKKYCSMQCVSSAYKKRMTGPDNPNHKSAGVRICERCGSKYRSYDSNRKFCSKPCYHKSRVVRTTKTCVRCATNFVQERENQRHCGAECYRADNPAKGYVPRPRPVHMTTCEHCGTRFRSSPSSNRKFCGYQCFVDSGGPRRAGEAAVKSMKKYGAKKDANHKEVFAAISEITAVKDLSAAGCGVPDGIAWVDGGWHLFDVKNPNTGYGKRGLNKRQKSWADDWRGGPVFLIYTVEEARRFARGNFCEIKRFPTAGTVLWGDLVIPVKGVIS